MVGYQAVHHGLQLTGIHCFEAVSSGDGRRVVAGLHHLSQNLLGLSGGQRIGGFHLHQFGEVPGVQIFGTVHGQVVGHVGQDPFGVGSGVNGGQRQTVQFSGDGHGRSGTVGTLGGEGVSTLFGQGWQRSPNLVDPLLAGVDRDQVGIGEVPVVLGLLLGAPGSGPATLLIPVSGFLARCVTVLVELHMTAGLEDDGPSQRT